MEVTRISPKRLKRNQEATGVHTGWSAAGYLLFGLPFIAVGVWTGGMGFGLIPHDPEKLNAPLWSLGVFGTVFGAGGLMVWTMAFRRLQLKGKLKAMQVLYPGDPAMEDYPWDRTGFSPPRWAPVRNAAFGLGFMVIFLSFFNWWAFASGDGPMLVKISVGFFDVLLIGGVFHTIYIALQALKFGETRLLYEQFPYGADEVVELKIQVPPVLREARSAKLSLRGIREFYEVTGSGKNRSKRLVHEAHFEGTQELTKKDLGQWSNQISTFWALPADLRETDLTSSEPFYWELELALDLPGIDLAQRYLLPVYRT